MSYGSEKSFTGKNQNPTNPKRHKKFVAAAAAILIVAAIAWTILYSKARMTTGEANPVDAPPAAVQAP